MVLEKFWQRYRDSNPDFSLERAERPVLKRDRKSTRLNSSHGYISYAVFCLKKKNTYHSSTSSQNYTRPSLLVGLWYSTRHFSKTLIVSSFSTTSTCTALCTIETSPSVLSYV